VSAPAPGPVEGSLGLRTPAEPGLQTAALPPTRSQTCRPVAARTLPAGQFVPQAERFTFLSNDRGQSGGGAGLFFVFAWAMRRASPGGSTVLPAEVVEVLGRTRSPPVNRST